MYLGQVRSGQSAERAHSEQAVLDSVYLELELVIITG